MSRPAPLATRPSPLPTDKREALPSPSPLAPRPSPLAPSPSPFHLPSALARLLAEPTRVVGVGNPLRGDDGVGAWVAERLAEGPLPAGVTVTNAEDVIENHAFPIAECDAKNVLLVDCVAAPGLPRGAILLDRLDALERPGAILSTHKLALSASARIFRAHGKETWLLGVVSDRTDFGAPLAPDTRETAAKVVELIRTAGRTA